MDQHAVKINQLISKFRSFSLILLQNINRFWYITIHFLIYMMTFKEKHFRFILFYFFLFFVQHFDRYFFHHSSFVIGTSQRKCIIVKLFLIVQHKNRLTFFLFLCWMRLKPFHVIFYHSLCLLICVSHNVSNFALIWHVLIWYFDVGSFLIVFHFPTLFSCLCLWWRLNGISYIFSYPAMIFK